MREASIGRTVTDTDPTLFLFLSHANEGIPAALKFLQKMNNKRNAYVAPDAELLEVQVEKGFAVSGDGNDWSNTNPWG